MRRQVPLEGRQQAGTGQHDEQGMRIDRFGLARHAQLLSLGKALTRLIRVRLLAQTVVSQPTAHRPRMSGPGVFMNFRNFLHQHASFNAQDSTI